MPRRRSFRLGIAILAALALFVAQMALARYVCPQQLRLGAMAAMFESGMPCAGMDADQPALCHSRSSDPAKLGQVGKLPLPVLPDLAPTGLLRLPEPSQPATAAIDDPLVLRPPDPILLSTLRLRL